MTIRVLWLVKGLGPGGAERLLVEHAASRDRDAFEYEIAYVLDWKQHLVPELEAIGVRTHCLGVRSETDPRWPVRLAHLLRSGDHEVVHAHSPLVASVARLELRTLPRRRRPAMVYTEHNRWPSYRAATRIANELTYALDDAQFAVSEDVRSSISARHRHGIEVLVHGIDVDRVRRDAARDDVRAELGIEPGTRLAVTVANLRASKNYPGLLAAARVVADRGVPVRFVAAGQGPLQEEIAALHGSSGLGDRFQLLGYRDDTTRLIAAADVFVLASRHEGLPVTVMEALTLGVPVVAPAVGGLPEVVTTDDNGILCAPGSDDALADAVERALQPDVHARLVEGARRTGDRFSNAHAVARVEDTYRRLAVTPRR